MRGIGAFLKTTMLGGFFVLFPIIVVVQLVLKAVELARSATAPIIGVFPKHFLDEPRFPLIVAIAVVAAACFASGLLARLALARAVGRRLEAALLLRLPGYRAIKGLTRGFAGSSEAGAFKPALLRSPDGYREFAYLIELHESGEATVMVPGSPTSMTGSVRIVRGDLIEPLEAGLSDVAGVLGQLGVGAEALLARSARQAEAREERGAGSGS